jgi:ERCC4-type nuclease
LIYKKEGEMSQKSKKQRARDKAIESCDPNRIVWVLNRSVARALFQHSLNVTTAYKKTDKELLKLKGIGPHALRAIKMAMKYSL